VLGTCPIGHAPQAHKSCKHHQIGSSGHTNKFSTSQTTPSLRTTSLAKLSGASFTIEMIPETSCWAQGQHTLHLNTTSLLLDKQDHSQQNNHFPSYLELGIISILFKLMSQSTTTQHIIKSHDYHG
jgi:hypothetical protein